VIVAAVVALAMTYSVKASPQAGQVQDPMTALLAEVHGLRLAIEQSTTVAPRVQLTLARLNIEEQRVAQLSGQLDQVRRELSASSLELQRLTDELRDLENGFLRATEDKMRKAFEDRQAETKRQLARQSRLVQELRTRENESAQAVSTEQGRWMDINARLDELERLLGPVPR
jgi:chromosome segregation ATPase